MKFYYNDYVKINSKIKLIQYKNDYRALNISTGILLKLNTTATLVLMILNERIKISVLMEQLCELLENESDKLNENDILETLSFLYCRKFIYLEKNIKKSTIVLINPCTSNEKGTIRKINCSPPLGLLLIGTNLRENDFDVKIIDMNIEDLCEDDILHRIRNINFNYIGISMNFTMCAESSLRIAKLIKDEYKNIPIILGGNHATFTYKEFLHNYYVDYVIKYSGHETFVELIKILDNTNFTQKELLTCNGIAFYTENKIVSTTEREKYYEINELPLFDWNLVPFELYHENRRWNLFTSVGCTNSCYFCSTSRFNSANKISKMQANTIIKHIQNIFYYENARHIYLTFVDDAFTCDKKRIKELCNLIIENNIKIYWGCNARVDQIDYDLIQIMKKSRCDTMFFGIESCDEQVLLKTNKNIRSDMIEKLTYAKKAGISITLSFILGLPGETKESLQKVKEFINIIKPKYARFSFLVLYPGTEYFINREKYGLRQINDSIELYENYIPYIETNELTAEDQLQAYIELIEFAEINLC